ncbi:MAG: DUF3854 domain-containing protein [Alkalinema sp. RL_2_19]|nr:DUF3854 domain-containing protein [Alkalinema sp. RL_2_19]
MCATLATRVLKPAEAFQSEFIHGSGIASSLYQSAVRVVSDLESKSLGEAETPIHDALNWRYSRFGLRANESLLAALLLNEDGSCWQAKLANPKRDQKSGKVRKYETPVGNGARAFFPAIPNEIWELIAKRYSIATNYEGSFWDWVSVHPEIPIGVTEGGKKALAALSQGYVTIALYGVNSGVSKYETIGGERIRKLQPELIPNLQRFAVPDRRFILAFDQDVKPKTRYRVEGALADLSWHLEQAQASVSIASWEGQNGRCKGLDDLIVNAGVEAWDTAYDQAIPATEWRVARQLATQVRRQPDLSIGDREFAEVIDQLPTSGIVTFWGGKGTGKSKASGKLIEGRQWVSITPLQSLARDQAASWGGVFINDGDQVGSTLLKDGQPVNGASVCIPSLMKLAAIPDDVLILDETTAGLEFLLGSKLANKGGLRPILLRELEQRVRNANLIVLADADLSEDAIRYIELIRGERAFLVRSDRKPLNYTAHLIDGTRNQAIAMFLERVQAVSEEKLVWLNCDAKAIVDQLTLSLEQQGLKCLKITSDTSGGEMEQAFLASKGRMLPQLIQQKVRVIFSSPSVTQGFSVEQHTDLIDSVWGIYTGSSISAHSIAQAPDRIRDRNVPRFLHVAKKGKSYSRLSRAESIGRFLREFKSVNSATARLVKHSLKPETVTAVEKLDWESENLKLLASFEVRRNRGMRTLRETVSALLRQEGKQIQMIKPSISKAEAKSVEEQLKTSRQAILLQYANAVSNAKELTEEEVNKLERKAKDKALSPKEIHALERFYIAQFYRLEQVERDDVIRDRQGKTRREVRNLEMVLNADLAETKSVNSIELNPDTPQDWSKAVVQYQLLEMSGMGQLIRDIYAGLVTELDSEQVGTIAAYLQAHPQEFQLAFGFSNVGKVAPMQAVTTVLDWCAIKRTVHRRREGGEVLRIYRIDAAHLSFLQSLLERRQAPDPAPEVDKWNMGDGSVEVSSYSPAFAPSWGQMKSSQFPESVIQRPRATPEAG